MKQNNDNNGDKDDKDDADGHSDDEGLESSIAFTHKAILDNPPKT